MPPPERTIPQQSFIARARPVSCAPIRAAADGATALPRFSIDAYGGGKMYVGWGDPIMLELAGISVPKELIILADHDRTVRVGHAEKVTVADRLQLDCILSGTCPTAQEFAATSRNGMPWQASVGAEAMRYEFVEAGAKAKVNGQMVDGPFWHIIESNLKEVSIVAIGADDTTSARVAASKESTMPTPNPSGTGAGAAATASDALTPGPGTTAPAPGTTGNSGTTSAAAAAPAGAGAPAGTVTAGADDLITANRLKIAAEYERVAEIQAAAAGHPAIIAQAIREGWTKDRTELAVMRAARPAPGAPSVGASRGAPDQRTLEAAVCMAGHMPEQAVIRAYGQQVVEAAGRMRRMGLRELAAMCCQLDGVDVPGIFGDGQDFIRASFSSSVLPGVLANAMGKVLLAAYEAQESVALQLCRIGSVKDFKKVTRTRLLGAGRWERVGEAGELKSAKFSDKTFEAQARTKGVAITLTREDFINDDLGAWLQLPAQLGADAKATIDEEFFTLLLANAGSFFGAGNGNYLSGAATAFGSAALTAARAQFRKMKAGPGSQAKDKKPINIVPKILLTPIEIEGDAEILLGSAQLMLNGAASEKVMPTDNPHRNRYKLLSAPHLSDSFYTGYSAKAWYLFADPAQIAAFEAVFLNGKQDPTIETVAPPAGTLGFAWAAYIDFGIAAQDPNGALMVKGEA